MTSNKKATTFLTILCGWLSIGFVYPHDAAAYVDPGTTGAISQILYVLFYCVFGAVFYFIGHIKRYLAKVKEAGRNLFAGRK